MSIYRRARSIWNCWLLVLAVGNTEQLYSSSNRPHKCLENVKNWGKFIWIVQRFLNYVFAFLKIDFQVSPRVWNFSMFSVIFLIWKNFCCSTELTNDLLAIRQFRKLWLSKELKIPSAKWGNFWQSSSMLE